MQEGPEQDFAAHAAEAFEQIKTAMQKLEPERPSDRSDAAVWALPDGSPQWIIGGTRYAIGDGLVAEFNPESKRGRLIHPDGTVKELLRIDPAQN